LIKIHLNILLSALHLGAKQASGGCFQTKRLHSVGDRKNFDFRRAPRAKFFGWSRRKQKERSVQGAGITPEAVPSEGGRRKPVNAIHRLAWLERREAVVDDQRIEKYLCPDMK